MPACDSPLPLRSHMLAGCGCSSNMEAEQGAPGGTMELQDSKEYSAGCIVTVAVEIAPPRGIAMGGSVTGMLGMSACAGENNMC
jgi:hypothetical protein